MARTLLVATLRASLREASFITTAWAELACLTGGDEKQDQLGTVKTWTEEKRVCQFCDEWGKNWSDCGCRPVFSEDGCVRCAYNHLSTFGSTLARRYSLLRPRLKLLPVVGQFCEPGQLK